MPLVSDRYLRHMSMSPKKKPAKAAQNLIDSLLDERTPAPSKGRNQNQNQDHSETSAPDAETRVISISRNTHPIDQLPESTEENSVIIDFNEESSPSTPLSFENEAHRSKSPAKQNYSNE